MNRTLVAERYASALFDLAVENKSIEEVYQDSLVILKACEESKDLRLLLKSPIINTGKKLSILNGIFGANIHPLTMTYISIMVRKKRERFVPEIAEGFTELYKLYKNILTVHFLSPVAPEPAMQEQVITLMKKYTNRNIDLDSTVDESLIGGFILRWDDKQYDASIRREIENMRNAIAKVNLYKKEF